MKSGEMFPFVRNNYYSGKQLTARDFRREQDYRENKMRAFRYAVCGSGVAAGLDVVAVGVNMLSVESGYAVDSLGREIIVPKPILKNVEALEGYDDIDAGLPVYLCIEYKETPVEPASLNSDSGITEYGGISEGYRLYLTNSRPSDMSCGIRGLIESEREIFRSDGARITVTVPKYVSIDETLVVKIRTEKRGLNEAFSAELDIKHENFSDGRSDVSRVTYYNVSDAYDIQTDLLTLTPSRLGIGINTIRAENIRISVGGDEQPTEKAVTFDTEIIAEPAAERLRREFFYGGIEPLSEGTAAERLYLAEISLSASGSGAVVERVTALPFGQYIMSERLSYLLANLSVKPGEQTKPVPSETAGSEPREEANEFISCGVENIDIDMDLKGKVYYSSEIIHGLGEGSINYSIGAEPVSGPEDTIIFGEPSLFAGSPYDMDFPKLQYSVISYNDKGTFRIAVKLLDRIGAGSIKLHWQAVKANEHRERDMIEIERVSVSIRPNLVNIEPRESVRLECVIEGCDNPNCIWNVEDKNGGTISRNGVYKAPSAEGVYTVTAASVKYPTKKAVNYIIVSKRREI